LSGPWFAFKSVFSCIFFLFLPSGIDLMPPNVVAIIVSYKCAALTIESIRSLAAERASSGLSLRAIIVDNASGDAPAINAAVVDSGWADWVQVHCAPFNGGFAYGNNLGMELAFADVPPTYFYLLNPDAQVRTGAIDTLTRFLDSHPDVGIAGSSFENADGSDWPIAFRFPTLMSELLQVDWTFLYRVFRQSNVARQMSGGPQPTDWICGASMLIRTSILSIVGGMDENYFLYYEETDFCLRAKRAGFSTWYVPESRVMHIMGQSTSVTDTTAGVKRLPGYWFESRKRFFAVSYGIWRAMVIDVVAILANSIGLAKRVALGRHDRIVPHFIRDLIKHSILRRRNRRIAQLRNFRVPNTVKSSLTQV
jgi:N-acetylglucosaminyl-diphospho-decaprenol L-rhamnosyltransferase